MAAVNVELVEVCESAARAAGEVLLDWVGRFAARLKGPRDLVSEADLASQHVIEEVIRKAFPDHFFVGEEQAAADRRRGTPNDYHWIVDPLDGTANYVHGVPHYAVSIGVEQNGRVLAGVVFDPVLQEMFSGTAGGGAQLNGVPIQTSGVARLEEALVSASFPPRVTVELPVMKEFVDMTERCQGIRRGGSAALNLAYIAAGRFDGYWAADLHPWDAAAGVLLVQESGGTVTHLSGEPFDVWRPKLLAAASTELHAAMADVIRRAG